MAKPQTETKSLRDEISEMSVQDRAAYLRQLKSVSEVTYRKAIKEGLELVPGKGKGLEPKPWCSCHNRNPCPTVVAAERIINS